MNQKQFEEVKENSYFIEYKRNSWKNCTAYDTYYEDQFKILN